MNDLFKAEIERLLADKMSQQSLRKNDRYFVIGNNMKCREFPNMEIALKQDDILYVVKDMLKSFYTPGSSVGFDWRISTFLIFDKLGNSVKVKANNWILNDVEITYKSSTQMKFNACILDSSNILKRIGKNIIKQSDYSNFDENDIDILLEAVKMLHEVSVYTNWSEFALKEENEALKKEIIRLQAELDKKKS